MTYDPVLGELLSHMRERVLLRIARQHRLCFLLRRCVLHRPGADRECPVEDQRRAGIHVSHDGSVIVRARAADRLQRVEHADIEAELRGAARAIDQLSTERDSQPRQMGPEEDPGSDGTQATSHPEQRR